MNTNPNAKRPSLKSIDREIRTLTADMQQEQTLMHARAARCTRRRPDARDGRRRRLTAAIPTTSTLARRA
ncbi:MAG: hypothetical protein ABI779_23950 [Acidobacteriota bacterium]